MDKYSDIINLPHHTSRTRNKMSIDKRAAQFAPFAALKGHKEAIIETERLTDKKIELDESEKIILNNKLLIIKNNLSKNLNVTITYFIKDNKKSGGRYVSITDSIKKIDIYNKLIITSNNTKINIYDIINITSMDINLEEV